MTPTSQSALPGSPQQRRAYLAWVAVCILWGTTYLAIRITLESFPPLAMAGTRFLLAGVALAAIVAFRGIPLPPRRSWLPHAILGTLMIAVGNGCVVWAEQFVPSGIAAVMVSMIPFWMVSIQALIPGGERIGARQVVGLLIGFGGIVMLTSASSDAAGAGPRFIHGVVALQCSCLGWSIGSAYSKRHARHENAIAAAALQMIFGGIVLAIAGTVAGEWHAIHFTLRSTLAVIYLITFGSLVGYVCYIYALKYLPVTTVSLYAYVNPVIAVFLGMLLAREALTGRMALAIGVIAAAMLIVRRTADTSRS